MNGVNSMRDMGLYRPFGHLLPFGDMFPQVIQPAVDVYHTEKDIVVTVEIPGVEKENLAVSVTGNSLSIKGHIEKATEAEHENYYHAERSQGSFFRSIPLPGQLDTENATAKYRNGILEIRIPKAEMKQSKQLDIDLQ